MNLEQVVVYGVFYQVPVGVLVLLVYDAFPVQFSIPNSSSEKIFQRQRKPGPPHIQNTPHYQVHCILSIIQQWRQYLQE